VCRIVISPICHKPVSITVALGRNTLLGPRHSATPSFAGTFFAALSFSCLPAGFRWQVARLASLCARDVWTSIPERSQLCRFWVRTETRRSNHRHSSFFGFCLAQVEDDYDRAIRYCRSASEARPLDPVLHVNLGKVYKLSGNNSAAHKEFVKAWDVCRGHPAAAAELTRMGIRRPSVVAFLPRSHWINRYLGVARANLERRLLHRRMC
jgi:hypothetical protein